VVETPAGLGDGPAAVQRWFLAGIRAGDDRVWEKLISRYEGRLMAYALARVADRAAAEDIVQETFLGLLGALEHYDEQRPLESFLFGICGYKLIDHLRRQGRRPTLPLGQGAGQSLSGAGSAWQPAAAQGPASALARSHERRQLERQALAEVLREQLESWKAKGDWTKLKCLELLMVVGCSNTEVAERLGVTPQQVANWKSDFLQRTARMLARRQLNPDVFPELYG
jgi:RNA polymerase sigma-70 factor, ECF subfamily